MRRSCRPGQFSRPARSRPAIRAIAANSFISPNKLYQTKRVCPAPCICSPSCSCCSWLRSLALSWKASDASSETASS
ncbi:unnamed protein product [Danaus chrysippus]|uniref:(African queen) hypothetical protein n=1 Tax=Danaus chrysippus TaxID=151541 RepID=A0A8J2VS07_9NEOP|nr:unnamed protein product [Danaus chrysippus]